MRLLLLIFLFYSFPSFSETYYEECWVEPVDSASRHVITGSGRLTEASSTACRALFVSSMSSSPVLRDPPQSTESGDPIAYNINNKYAFTGDGCETISGKQVCKTSVQGSRGYISAGGKGEFRHTSGAHFGQLITKGVLPPDFKPACETPKTDDQCNKGKTATITGNDVFWATGNYKGCTFTAADGVFIKLADGSMTGDATSTGSTGKSWCETTDSSYNPADDEALSKNPAFSPAKDNDPKNCKNGWVQAGGGKFHCLNDTSGNVDAPPDKVNPEDGSINSDKDGKPQPPDAGVGKPPTGGTDPDGGGGTGPDGGGDCEGEDCEGGGGGTKPPARPADPWADILDAADVARVKADTQSVQDELADFYRSAASGFQININKPAAGAMPSYGDITQGGQKISLSMSWLDKISFADGRAGVLVLCSLIAAYIILVRR